MQSTTTIQAFKNLWPALAAGALVATADSILPADDSPRPRSSAELLTDPVAPSILGLRLRSASIGGQPAVSQHSADEAEGRNAPATAPPPAPMEPDRPVAQSPAPIPAQSFAPGPPVLPRAPFRPPFGRRSGFHSRLWAKRLYRVQQMRQSAEQSGDSEGVQRAEYLEGMVNELHRKGLFNFAQKVVGAMQSGQLNGVAGESPSGATDLPETDLGEAAPLPDVDLGAPAPVPTQSSQP